MGKFADVLDFHNQQRPSPHPEPNRQSDPPEMGTPSAEITYTRPKQRHPLDCKLVTLHHPQSLESEQFKQLRTGLLFPVSGKVPRSIMITSSSPGEGKSFVTANLAISIAQGIEQHVLLLDCDLRRPRLHTLFGYENVEGLQEYLNKNKPLSSLLLNTGVEKLTLLPAGEPPNNPAELLSSEKMFQLINEVRDRYSDRFVLIDSPPPQLTAESNAIARYVDGILLVVESGKTPRESILDLIETFGKDKIVGTVLNRFDLRMSAYYGRYGKSGEYYQRLPVKKA